MQELQEITTNLHAEEELFAAAKGKAKRVVLKRAKSSPEIAKPDAQVKGKSNRYDIYFNWGGNDGDFFWLGGDPPAICLGKFRGWQSWE